MVGGTLLLLAATSSQSPKREGVMPLPFRCSQQRQHPRQRPFQVAVTTDVEAKAFR
jgi:hypothetical protein